MQRETKTMVANGTLALAGVFMMMCHQTGEDLTKFEQCVVQKSEEMGVPGVVQNFKLDSVHSAAMGGGLSYSVKSFGTAQSPGMVDFGYQGKAFKSDIVKRNADAPQAQILETAVKICAESNLNMSYKR